MAALMFIVAVALTTGCKKDSAEPNIGGNNGGGNGGSTLTEEGIYLGVIGFNQNFKTKEIGLLNNTTLSGYESFIGSLNMENGTGLYYADYTALNMLKNNSQPPKLTNVAFVTFTDGLDNVSLSSNETNPEHYTSTEAYRAALSNKIRTETVYGKNITAYTIGIKGPDVLDDEEFHNNLNMLASSANNVYEITDMSQSLQCFAEIAESLHSVTTNTSLKLQIPGGYNDGQLIRFTFDNVSDAGNSTKYIECTYKWSDNGRRLENITYHGLIAAGQSDLNSIAQIGLYYEFEFKNITHANGNIIQQSDISKLKLWRRISSGAWQPDVEFTPANSSQIIEEQSSALIMLVLDCTTSLGNAFSSMKNAAKQFVRTLISSGGSGTTTTPTVATSSVSDITYSSAICGGNVTSDGGASVTARGICWSTNPNPTTGSSHASGGTGTGSFTASMTGLAATTTYYVRAYATNSKGTSYGEQEAFTTASGGGNYTVPIVSTSSVTNITQNSAKCGGNVTSDGGATVTERGICWSTSTNPTVNSNHVSSGSGTGSFTVNMTGLNPNTTYFVRAYAKNSVGISYGAQKNFTTEINIIEEWLYYGDWNNHQNCWGLTNGGSDEWAVMFPTSTLSQYNGTSITKVDVYLGATGSYTLKIYKGGTSQPSTLLKSQTFSVSSEGWNTINISPLVLQTNSTLWVSISCSYNAGVYPKGACAGVNNHNARWVNPNGNGWHDVYDDNNATDICWEIQAYVTNDVKGEDGTEIQLPQTLINIENSSSIEMQRNPNEVKKYK